MSENILLLTIPEAAEMARLSKSTIERAIKGNLPNSPTLPSIQPCRRILIRKESLLRWLDALESHS